MLKMASLSTGLSSLGSIPALLKDSKDLGLLTNFLNVPFSGGFYRSMSSRVIICSSTSYKVTDLF